MQREQTIAQGWDTGNGKARCMQREQAVPSGEQNDWFDKYTHNNTPWTACKWSCTAGSDIMDLASP